MYVVIGIQYKSKIKYIIKTYINGPGVLDTPMSANKSTIAKTFNTHFFEFLDDLLTVFPDCKDIAVLKKSIETIQRLNTSIVIKIWYNSVYSRYKEDIDNGNMEYFLKKDYGSDLAPVANSGEILKVIDIMRERAINMNDANKAHTMQYLQNLSKLSALYNTL